MEHVEKELMDCLEPVPKIGLVILRSMNMSVQNKVQGKVLWILHQKAGQNTFLAVFRHFFSFHPFFIFFV